MGPEYDTNEEISAQSADNKLEFPHDVKSARNTKVAPEYHNNKEILDQTTDNNLEFPHDIKLARNNPSDEKVILFA